MQWKIKHFALGLLALIMTACGAAGPSGNMLNLTRIDRPSLPDLGAAPEWENSTWLNSDSPLRLQDLHGKVVALEMWTFGCINCQHVIPSLKQWQAAYAEQGLVIIGNHYPEFGYEGDLENLKQAVARAGVQYAVSQDNDGATWRAYRNQYWPTLYLIDKRGHIRYVHVGEGAYAETERNIRVLLAESYP
jgi:thiol-disulfide isomerase/thioredoxin